VLLAVAMTAGWMIVRIGMEKHVEPWGYEMGCGTADSGSEPAPSWKGRIGLGFEAVRDIVGKVKVSGRIPSADELRKILSV
jgi:hypothetical protein